MSATCRTCAHWKAADGREYGPGPTEIERPIDPDTYEPMVLPFEVRQCQHPALVFYERPLERDGFAVADGSMYFAALYTAEDFGCVRHEAAT